MHHFFFLDSIANIDNPSIVRVVAATFLLPYIVVELKVLKEKYVFYETQRSQAGTYRNGEGAILFIIELNILRINANNTLNLAQQ